MTSGMALLTRPAQAAGWATVCVWTTSSLRKTDPLFTIFSGRASPIATARSFRDPTTTCSYSFVCPYYTACSRCHVLGMG